MIYANRYADHVGHISGKIGLRQFKNRWQFEENEFESSNMIVQNKVKHNSENRI